MSKPGGPEKLLQNAIIKWLRGNNVFCFPVNNGGVFDPIKKIYRTPGKAYLAGVSDIIGIYKGRFLALEVKTKYGKPTPEQLVFIERVREQGGYADIVRSIEDVELFLARLSS